METKKFRFDSFATEFDGKDDVDKCVDDIADNDSGIGKLHLFLSTLFSARGNLVFFQSICKVKNKSDISQHLEPIL